MTSATKVALVLVLGATGLLALVGFNQHEMGIQKAAWGIRQTALEYYTKVAKPAVTMALDLARPFLDDETRGKFLGRLEVATRPSLQVPPPQYYRGNSRGDILWDLHKALDSVPYKRSKKQGGGYDMDKLREEAEKIAAPLGTIKQLMTHLRTLERFFDSSFGYTGGPEVAKRELLKVIRELDPLLNKAATK